MEIIVPDSSRVYSGPGMVESKSVGTFSPLQKQDSHRGLLVDRGVGSPRKKENRLVQVLSLPISNWTQKQRFVKSTFSLITEDCAS